MTTEQRRLAAILVADVVGYSKLVGSDEAGTLVRLQKLRSGVIEPAIAKHAGRLFKAVGDGFLVEFASAVQAVEAARAIQQANADGGLPLRIGIHVGDVVVQGDDLMGDGVNIAARIEGVADPGGIAISRQVRDQVRDKLDVALIDKGEVDLKNIARPVRVFTIARTAPTQPYRSEEGQGQGVRPLALPDKPSIAVLPFQNMSGDPEQEYFADGLAEDLITGLSRVSWLFVIARNSSFAFRGEKLDVRTIGERLGVRYLVEGSVRRAGQRLRLTVQLIEAATGNHLWADRHDGSLEDVFDFQDRIVASLIGAIEPKLRATEIARARRKRPDNLDAYDLYLRALPLAGTAMPQDADKALRLLEEAIRLEPHYAVVHGFMAWCHEQRYLRGGLHTETREAARRHAYAAIEAGTDDAMALAMGGFVVGVVDRNYAIALDALDRSIALSPSSALAFGFSSIIRAWMGDCEIAIEHSKMGIRLSPYDPLIYLPLVGLAYAHFFAGNFVEAARAASRASAANPRFSVPCYLHTAALVQLGRREEAESMAKVLLELQPGFTVSGLVSGNITTPEQMELLAGALRQAGLPE